MNEKQKLLWDEITEKFAEISRQKELDEEKYRKRFEEDTKRWEEDHKRWEEERKLREEERKQREEERKQREEEWKKREEEWKKQEEERKQREEEWKKREEELKVTRKLAEEMSQSVKEFCDDGKRKITNLDKRMGGMGNSNGQMAENFFFNAFRKDKMFMNEKYDIIRKGYFYYQDEFKGEFDVLFFNGKNVVILEVKYHASEENVNIEKLLARVAQFKEYSPEYKNHNVYLGLAAMSFKKGFATKLHEEGIATVHPVGKKMVIFDTALKVF
jgi:DNA repair exonuclease SbcCD ATPase subunit